MTARTQRVVAVLAIVACVLLAGRWSVGFVAERWWAGTISSSAADFVTSWQLLGLALDLGATGVASIWFALQALIVARAIASVQLAHNYGTLQLREAIPAKFLMLGAVTGGVALGLLTGAGAHAWREPIVLAWQGVHYGVADPLLHADLGVFVAQLPAWDVMHDFVASLAIVSIVLCIVLYSSIGALRREHGEFVVHGYARRHLGILLGIGALVVAVGYALTPFHLAAAPVQVLTDGGAVTRIRAAQIMAGVSVAAAMLSLLWAMRGRNSFLVSGVVILVAGSLIERYVVPALAEAAPPPPSRLAAVRHADSLAWGIRESNSPSDAREIPAVTALWDPQIFARFAERAGTTLEAASPTLFPSADGRDGPAWLVATTAAGDSNSIDFNAVTDGALGPAGSPSFVHPPGSAHVRDAWLTLSDPRTRPSASEWRSVAVGVNASSPLRRILLAWARQAPGILTSQLHPNVDWHLAPVTRAAALLPMIDWSPAEIVIVNSRPMWLLQGNVSVDQFPLSTRARWGDGRAAGVVPALLCSIDVASGATTFYVDPAADSLGAAWARVIGPLVIPANAIPPELLPRNSYSAPWLSAQVEVLRAPAWNVGRQRQPTGSLTPMAPLWVTANTPGLQISIHESGSGAAALTATGYRVNGMPQLRIEHPESDVAGTLPNPEIRQQWSRAAALMHLRDSVTAAGDSIITRPMRSLSTSVVSAWQPTFTLPARGAPSLLWIATGIGDQVGGGRTVAEAWRTASDPDADHSAQGPTDASILAGSREWMLRADSALHRGDMTAFGRAFEELRRALARRSGH